MNINVILRHEDPTKEREAGASPSKFIDTHDMKYKFSDQAEKAIKSKDDGTLNLTNHYIYEIDTIPPKFQMVERLVLNNNHLKSLRGIEQFGNVRRLGLVDNELGDILNVYHLRHLKNLEELDLRGNEIQNHPHYRETILLFLPNLKQLDGKPIRSGERDRIDPELSKQYTLLDKLLHNYGELLKFQILIKKLDLHRNLFNRDKRFILNYTHFDIEKFKKMYRLLDTFDESIKNEYRHDLLRDVHTIETNLIQRDDMEAAANELINRQQAKINELAKQAEKKTSVMQTVYINNIEKIKNFDIPDDYVFNFKAGGFRDTVRSAKSVMSVRSELGPKTSRDKSYMFTSRGKEFDSFSQSIRSPQSVRDRKTRSSIPHKSLHKIEVANLLSTQKSLSPIKKDLSPEHPRELVMSPSNKELYQTYKKMTEKEGEGEHHKSLSHSAFQSPSGKSTHQRLDTLNFSVRDASMYGEGKEGRPESPFKELTSNESNADKERQITRLAKSLKQKIDEVIQVEDVNRQLKDKLRAFQDQNEQNIKIANDEIKSCNLELEKALMSKRDMEREVNNLKRELNNLMSKYQEVEQDRTELVNESIHYKKIERELYVLKDTQDKADLAYKYYEQKIIEKAFQWLKFGVNMSKRLDAFLESRKERKANRLKIAALKTLQRNAIIKKIVKYRQHQRAALLMATHFAQWKMFGQSNKLVRYNSFKMESNVLLNTFSALVDYKNIRKRRRLISQKLDAYYKEKLLRNSMRALKGNWKLYRHPSQIQETLEDQADQHYVSWMARVSFFKWKKHVKEVAVPKRIRNRIAYVYYKKNLLKIGLNLLISNYNFYFDCKEKVEAMRRRHYFRLVGELFSTWKHDLKFVNQEREKRREQEKLYILGKKFAHWRGEFAAVQRAKAQEKRAADHYKIRTTIKYYQRIIEHGIKSQNRKIVYNAVKRNLEAIAVNQSFKSWHALFRARVEERTRIQNENMALQDKYLSKWIKYALYRKNKHRQDKQAYRLFAKHVNNRIENIFAKWKEFSFGRKRGRNVEGLLQDKKKIRVYKAVFDALKIKRIRRLKKKFFDLYREFETTKASLKKSLEYTNEADEERIKLIGNLETLSHTIDSLKSELNNKTKEHEDVTLRLQSSEENESRVKNSLERTLDDLAIITARYSEVNGAYEKKSEDYDKLHQLYHSEKNKLVQTLQTLETEVERKQDTINDLERENRELGEQFTKNAAESQERMTHLDGQVRQLKDSIRSKEDELTDATELLGHYEKSNLELKNKLAETIGELENSSLRYQDTIQSLEIKNHSLHDDIKTLQRDNEIHVRELQDLRDTIRMYETQMAQMTEAQHKDTEEFIHTIHKGKHIPPLGAIISKRDEFSFERRRGGSPRNLLEQEQFSSPIQPKSAYYSPKSGSPLRDFLARRDQRAAELDAMQDRTQEDVTRKGSIKHQFNVTDRLSLKPILKSPPRKSEKETFVKSPLKSPLRKSVKETQDTRSTTNLVFTSSIDDIQRDIEKLKSSKKTLLDNIEQRNRALRSSFKK